MSLSLAKNPAWKGRRGPVVLVVMDGVGYGKYAEGDAVAAALLPNFRALEKAGPSTRLKAHGKAVGLPSDEDMGNSEVGHNAIGCGRVFSQGAKLVSASIESGALFEGATWKKLVANAKASKGALHFIGLFSDGNVHSHLDHLEAMVARAAAEGVAKVRVHALLDGRDVGEQSALEYVDRFEKFLALPRAKGCDARIASGGGRQYITMDRYGADWAMVERGWKTHVLGQGRQFASVREAVETYRRERPGVIDQDLGEFVVAEGGRGLQVLHHRGRRRHPVVRVDSAVPDGQEHQPVRRRGGDHRQVLPQRQHRLAGRRRVRLQGGGNVQVGEPVVLDQFGRIGRQG
ncbi:MAG TPA: hypothetical protein PKW82_09355, partial [Spirochaetales bacterium]|nr:hypothetical protein [Spirochaetales bacterium]